MKFLGENGMIIIVKTNSLMTRECYAKSLKVVPYLVKAPTTTITIDEILDIPKEHDTDRP